MDARVFWKQLQDGELPGCIQKGQEPIYQLPDDMEMVFSFHHYETELNGHVLYEILAVDVSEEYRIIQELQSRRVHVDQVRKRLKELSKTITRTTAEKEVLSAKVHLHDDFGRMLLLSKRYLLDPGAVDRKELLATWRLNIKQLKEEKPEEWQ